MSQYHKMDPNAYPNMFGCPRIDLKNIRIYTDAQEMTEFISEYNRKVEKHKYENN